MLRQKVTLPELYKVVGNVTEFLQNVGPETTKYLGT